MKYLTLFTPRNRIFGLMLLTCVEAALGQVDKNTSISEYLRLANQHEQQGDKRQASHYLNEAATLEWEQKQYAKAIEYFEKSLTLNVAVGNQNGINGIYNNLGMLHNDMHQYEKALEYFQKNLVGRRAGGDKVSLIASLVNISVILNNLQRYQDAVGYLEESLAIARETSDAKQMRSCYGMLAETYEKMGNNERMMHYFDLYRTFHEKVQGEREKVAFGIAEKAQLETKNMALNLKLAEKENEISLLAKERVIQSKEQQINVSNTKQEALLFRLSKTDLVIRSLKQDSIAKENEAKIKSLQLKENQDSLARTRLTRNFLIAGAFLLAGLIGMLLFRYREKQKTNQQLAIQNQQILEQKDEIEDQNKHITDSIMYAQRIQAALLTDTANLQKIIPESFILFQPKDIVSGDFYWFEETFNKTIIAAVDCTGHGVPGAFMSMLGSSFLRKIVNEEGITESDKILARLHTNVREALHQNESENKDGMDIALYVIDKAQQKLDFCGAHNPLIYIQGGELHEIKGSPRSVGGYEYKNSSIPFTKSSIEINEPTALYVFSDGFQDQFGGPNDRKFMVKRLKQLLLEIHQQPLAEQQVILANTLAEWKGNQKQIDDILVIGAKISPEILSKV
jgi:serine phosphatase RsbU (regulator of sigma subunit)